jgi:DNA (cytosine-5)-methyltransferase 1
MENKIKAMERKIGIFSFFAGAGFLDLGFELSGHYETLFVNELRKPFLDAYKSARKRMGIPKARFGWHSTDITEYLTNLNAQWLKNNLKEAKSEFDLVGFIGGPPCPDFSVGGKNRGKEGENGKLSGTYVRLICDARPDFFLFENVKGLYRTKIHREFFNFLKQKLIESGYCLSERLINAIEYGAPQDRERIILIGFHKSALHKIGREGKDGELIDFDWEGQRTYNSADVFSQPWPSVDVFDEEIHRGIPLGISKELTVEYWFQKNAVQDHPNSVHFFIPRAGLSKFQVIAEGDDLKKSYKRLHRWRYSPTAAYGNNEVHLHPYRARRITAAEALAIQSLPKEFVIPEHISLSDMFKMIGNGVPFLAALGLANTIFDYISPKKKTQNIGENEKADSKRFGEFYQSAR